MNKFFKTGLLATAAVALSLVGFGHAFGYGGGGGGGGGAPRADITLSVTINNDEAQTKTPAVTLNLEGGKGATGMAISNTADFADTVVIPYQKSIAWTLSPGAGTKTVYVKFFRPNSNNSSPVLTDTITVDPAFVAPTAPQEVLGEKITDIDGLIAELRYGMRSEKVRLLQEALKKAGFFPNTIGSTGFYGPVTDLAVKKYLASLTAPTPAPIVPPVTAPISDELIGALRFGMRGPQVVALQDALKALGFFPLNIQSTGYFGPITQSSVEKYLASK